MALRQFIPALILLPLIAANITFSILAGALGAMIFTALYLLFCVDVVKFCVEHEVDVVPGCVTPTEIIKAVACGINTVKFFPANIYGGLSAMKALNGPFPRVSFVPTGGVNGDNLKEYLKAPYIRAVGGSWICSKKDISNGDFDHITALCREARESVDSVRNV